MPRAWTHSDETGVLAAEAASELGTEEIASQLPLDAGRVEQRVEQLGVASRRLESLATKFPELPPNAVAWIGRTPGEIEDSSGRKPRFSLKGSAAICRKQLEQDPMTGCALVFCNRMGTGTKILLCDGQGDWMWSKESRERT